MDPRLLSAYNRELEHVRESGAEFAKGFPKIASRLGLDGIDCADPYVERLLEGFAFMAARVQLKLESEFSRFTQSIFEIVYPDYLACVPSMVTVQFKPDLAEGSLAQGIDVPSGTTLKASAVDGSKTRCTFQTAHNVTLWPVQLLQAEYHTRDVAALRVGSTNGARAAIRLRLKCTSGVTFKETAFDHVTFHLRGVGSEAMLLYEQLFTHVIGVSIIPGGDSLQQCVELDATCISQVGFEDDEAILPYRPTSFQGFRLLQEYFAMPSRFMYAKINGLGKASAACESDEMDIVILLDRVFEELEGVVNAENFQLFCTPSVNLFEKRLDRIQIEDRFSEFHVVTDRLTPLDYEIHSIKKVTGFGAKTQEAEEQYEPFFRCQDDERGSEGCYYALHRVPRMLTERERQGFRRTVSYVGSEMYLTIVDESSTPYRPDLKQLGIVSLCTNRDLPIIMPTGQGTTDFEIDLGVPVKSIRCLGRPTDPITSRAEGEMAWRLISHLGTSYYSILDTEGGESGAAMREILELYGQTARPEVRQQIGGIVSLTAGPAIERVVAAGPASFARGLEVSLTMDESSFEGAGIFLLGSVLERFFAKYVTMNLFTTTVVKSTRRGEIKRWPPRLGLRHNL